MEKNYVTNNYQNRPKAYSPVKNEYTLNQSYTVRNGGPWFMDPRIMNSEKKRYNSKRGVYSGVS